MCELSERDGGKQKEEKEKEKWVNGNCKDLGREIVYERDRKREIYNNSYTLSIHNGGALKLSTAVDLVCVLSRMTVLQREQLKFV